MITISLNDKQRCGVNSFEKELNYQLCESSDGVGAIYVFNKDFVF